PPRSTFWREPGGCLAGVPQGSCGGKVALARRPLDMVGACRGRGPSRRERLGAPLVCTHAPPSSRALVCRSSEKWVAEAETSRDVGAANEVEPQELVDGVHRRSLRPRRRGCGKLELERIAR